MTDNNQSTNNLKKYRQGACVFMALNAAYLILVYIFLPPFNLGVPEAAGYSFLFLAFFGTLTYFIYIGSKGLVQFLIMIDTLRVVVGVVTLAKGQAFAAVPYILPCLLVTIYFLGRAAWDWP